MAKRSDIRQSVATILEGIDGLSVGAFDTESVAQSELPRAIIYTKSEQVIGCLGNDVSERKLALTIEIYTGGANAASAADQYVDAVEAALLEPDNPLCEWVDFYHLESIGTEVFNNEGAQDIAVATMTYQINYLGA